MGFLEPTLMNLNKYNSMIIILGAIVIYTMGTIFGYSLCNRHYKEDKRNIKI